MLETKELYVRGSQNLQGENKIFVNFWYGSLRGSSVY